VAEQIDETIRIILEDKECNSTPMKSYVRGLPASLKKICYKKYEPLFSCYLGRIKRLKVQCPSSYERIERKVIEVEALSKKRFST